MAERHRKRGSTSSAQRATPITTATSYHLARGQEDGAPRHKKTKQRDSDELGEMWRNWLRRQSCRGNALGGSSVSYPRRPA